MKRKEVQSIAKWQLPIRFNARGEKYFQIDTYGNSDREMPEKISQSFQLDRTTAEYLVKLIIEEFDLN